MMELVPTVKTATRKVAPTEPTVVRAVARTAGPAAVSTAAEVAAMIWASTVEVALAVDVLVAGAPGTDVPVEVAQEAAVQTLRLAATTRAPRAPLETPETDLVADSR